MAGVDPPLYPSLAGAAGRRGGQILLRGQPARLPPTLEGLAGAAYGLDPAGAGRILLDDLHCGRPAPPVDRTRAADLPAGPGTACYHRGERRQAVDPQALLQKRADVGWLCPALYRRLPQRAAQLLELRTQCQFADQHPPLPQHHRADYCAELPDAGFFLLRQPRHRLRNLVFQSSGPRRTGPLRHPRRHLHPKVVLRRRLSHSRAPGHGGNAGPGRAGLVDRSTAFTRSLAQGPDRRCGNRRLRRNPLLPRRRLWINRQRRLCRRLAVVGRIGVVDPARLPAGDVSDL